VRYLDSSGIGLLFNLARRVSRRQQEFAVVVPSDAAVREILTLSGAQHSLSLHDSLAEPYRSSKAIDRAPARMRPAEPPALPLTRLQTARLPGLVPIGTLDPFGS
jgi:hypothetical protein